MSKARLLATLCVAFIALAACRQKNGTPTPTVSSKPTSPPVTNEPLSPAAQEELDRLNAWDVRATAIVECPKDYPGFVDSGETRGWIITHEKNLQELGVSVHWNCEIKAYEVIPKGQASIPLCGCPPIK